MDEIYDTQRFLPASNSLSAFNCLQPFRMFSILFRCLAPQQWTSLVFSSFLLLPDGCSCPWHCLPGGQTAAPCIPLQKVAPPVATVHNKLSPKSPSLTLNKSRRVVKQTHVAMCSLLPSIVCPSETDQHTGWVVHNQPYPHFPFSSGTRSCCCMLGGSDLWS